MPPAQLEGLRAARKAYKAGAYADAARLFARVVADDGKCSDGWYGLGNARWRRGDREGAVEAWRRSVAEDASRPRAWQNLAAAWVATEQWAGAAEAAQKAVSLDPKRGKAWNTPGVAAGGLDDLDAAEAAFRKAIEVAQPRRGARTNLGHCLRRAVARRRALSGSVAGGDGTPETRLALARCHGARGDLKAAEGVLAEARAPRRTRACGRPRRREARPRRRRRGRSGYEGAAAAVVDLGGARARASRGGRVAALPSR